MRKGTRHVDGQVTGVARTLFGRETHGLRPQWFYSKLNRNKTKQKRSVNTFSWKIYFTIKGQIRILRVC
jgi:hypothetical protein